MGRLTYELVVKSYLSSQSVPFSFPAITKPSLMASSLMMSSQGSLSRTLSLPLPTRPRSISSNPNFLSFSIAPTPKPLRLSHRPNPQTLASRVSLLSDSTRTVCSIMSAAASLSASLAAVFSNWAAQPSSEEVANLLSLKKNLVWSAGPVLFAAKGLDLSFSTSPFKMVAAGIGKWLEIYSGILMLRVLFSWFPNVPWDKQPLSAIRDLCDPYLNLFRNVIPPLYSLDLSPLLAFAILGVLTSLLNTPS